MVPEKLDAFSKSGQSVMLELWKMHAAWWSQASRVGALSLAGRPPSLREAVILAERTQEYALSSMDATVRMNSGALAPVRRTAMNNARRLSASKSGKIAV
jgi:Flp pilus assembly protein CpaB